MECHALPFDMDTRFDQSGGGNSIRELNFDIHLFFLLKFCLAANALELVFPVFLLTESIF
jgi:hypothetical protein